MSKLNKLPVKNEVIHQLAIGETQTNIAKQVGVDRSQISRFANKDKNIKLIEEEQEKFIEIVPDAVQNVKNLVEEMPTLAKDDIDNRKLSFDASKVVLKATNILPSNQYAHLLTNIYNDNRQQTVAISDNVLNLLAPHFKSLIDPEIVESDEVEENSQDS